MDQTLKAVMPTVTAMHADVLIMTSDQGSPLTVVPHEPSLSPPKLIKGLANEFLSSTSGAVSPVSVPATPNTVSTELGPVLSAQSGKPRVSLSNQSARMPQSTR